jgi:hypothetical protein
MAEVLRLISLRIIEIYVKNVSTEINIAIWIANTISNKINNLRDQVLWPQTQQLIEGYVLLLELDVSCTIKYIPIF